MKRLWMVLLSAVPVVLWAQPGNDNPCSATNISVNYSASLSCTPNVNGLSYTNATPSGITAPTCGTGGTIADIWYRISPASSGMVTVRAASTGNGAMAVYSDQYSCSYFDQPLTCTDDTLASTNPLCTFEASAGSTYYIRFWIKGSVSGTLNGICAVLDAPPISSAQRVGIGTSNPQSNLDVNGLIQIRGGNPSLGKVLTSDGQGKASWLKINQNLEVPLELSGNRDNNHVMSVINTNILGSAIYARLGTSGYGFNFPRAAIWADTETEDALRGTSKEGVGVYAINLSGSEYALIASSTGASARAGRFLGNVDIGYGGASFNQGGNLSAVGFITADQYLAAPVLRAGGSTTSISDLNFSTNLGSRINLWGTNTNSHFGIGIQSSVLQIHTDVVGSDVVIGYGGTSNFTENARIKGNGNIGFGTTTPSRKMEVIAASGQSIITVGSKSAFGSGAIEFVSDYGIATQWRPGFVQSEDLGNFTGRLSFYTNGTGPDNRYGIVKGLEVRNGVTYTASGTVSSYSDIRLKKQIEPFSDGLNVIQQIKPVRFKYNEQAPFPTDQTQVGVIAQELERIAPYMVQLEPNNEFGELRTVNNQAYIFLLINAVKEQQEQIKKLQASVQALQQKLSEKEKP